MKFWNENEKGWFFQNFDYLLFAQLWSFLSYQIHRWYILYCSQDFPDFLSYNLPPLMRHPIRELVYDRGVSGVNGVLRDLSHSYLMWCVCIEVIILRYQLEQLILLIRCQCIWYVMVTISTPGFTIKTLTDPSLLLCSFKYFLKRLHFRSPRQDGTDFRYSIFVLLKFWIIPSTTSPRGR